jgi:hypothetical protein
VINAMTARLKQAGWKSRRSASGVEAIKTPSPDVEHSLLLVMIRGKEDGIFFQPSLAVRFNSVNEIKNQLTPNNFNRDAYTASVLLARLPGGKNIDGFRWFVPPGDGVLLNHRVNTLLTDVFSQIHDSGFFDGMQSVSDFVSAVQATKWSMSLDGDFHFLAALIALKRIDEMKEQAVKMKMNYINWAKAAGVNPDSQELAAYEQALSWNIRQTGSPIK